MRFFLIYFKNKSIWHISKKELFVEIMGLEPMLSQLLSLYTILLYYNPKSLYFPKCK